MMITQVKSHAVTAEKIVGVLPLMGRNTTLMSPDAGLTLVLENKTQHNWLSEAGGPAPAVGDFLVRDDELNATAIVSAAKFKELFSEVSHDE
ncbi:MAG TPA: hypothetical protein VGT24_13200 [Candidatus Acidoferrales bacterium]|nr:hypothetical protein [Candidatus Acidoferrales bacterium]